MKNSGENGYGRHLEDGKSSPRKTHALLIAELSDIWKTAPPEIKKEFIKNAPGIIYHQLEESTDPGRAIKLLDIRHQKDLEEVNNYLTLLISSYHSTQSR